MRTLKILVVMVVATLLLASPAFASVFEAETGFLTTTSLHGGGFDLDVGGFIGGEID